VVLFFQSHCYYPLRIVLVDGWMRMDADGYGWIWMEGNWKEKKACAMVAARMWLGLVTCLKRGNTYYMTHAKYIIKTNSSLAWSGFH